jgi:glycyl-tRNA synthetase beta chain
MAEFLFEIGLEEIPARMIASAQQDLAARVQGMLLAEKLLGAAAANVRSYATPRRLAVLVSGVAARQEDATEQLTGPAWKVAFKDGQPTPAAVAFARKAGVAVDALVKQTMPKGEYVSATVTKAGRSAAEILTEKLPAELGKIYWAKNMYWRSGKPERFVRPVRWMLALLDGVVVPVAFGGKVAGAAWRCAGDDCVARGVRDEAGSSVCPRRCERATRAHLQGAGSRDSHRGGGALARG